MSAIRKGLALVLAVSIAAGCSAVSLSAGPRFETVQQAAGCKCGNSYISCDKECHKDDGGGEGDPTALLWVLGIAAVAGIVYLVATHESGPPPEAQSSRPADLPAETSGPDTGMWWRAMSAPATPVVATSPQVEPVEAVIRPLLDSDLASGPVVGDATVKILYAPTCADYQWLVSSKRERAVLISSVSAAIADGYLWAKDCTPPGR